MRSLSFTVTLCVTLYVVCHSESNEYLDYLEDKDKDMIFFATRLSIADEMISALALL